MDHHDLARRAKLWHALTAFLAGFFIASTAAAPVARDVVDSGAGGVHQYITQVSATEPKLIG